MAIATNFTPTYRSSNVVPMFGAGSKEIGVYPNDVIILDVYNYTNDYLESILRVRDYQQNSVDFQINVENELHRLKYLSGKYNVTARFHRNYLGSADGDKLVIQEISSDRLEVRVVVQDGIPRAGTAVNNLDGYFAYELFNTSKKEVLPNLYIFGNPFTAAKIYDYVQDDITYPGYPYSIIFKLSQPLPTTFQIDTLVWIAQELSPSVSDEVTIYPPKRQLNKTTIAGPNFDIVTGASTNQTTDYQSWDDVLSTNTNTSLSLINKLFSGSLIEGIDLNVDFKEFKNYIHFGSAEERLRNFKYKMELIEYYDARIYSLSGSYADTFTGNSALTGSAEFVANVLDAKTKKSSVLGGFDSYEKYLYYGSSSYVSNSFGEYYPTTWPKQNSSKPYINYATTSSQAEDWFSGIIQSASVYDYNNIHSLRKIIPEYIYVSEQNEQYILFVDMIGHYFDLIYEYVNQLTSIHKRYESLTEGFAKELIYQIGHSLGLNAENGLAIENLWSYFLGTNENGTLISTTYGASVEDRSKEVWKRIIANLPYLLKTKGTSRGVRALINCYGIPSTILRVKEYGGPEPTFNSATQEEYDQFYYGLYLSGSNTSISIPQLSGGNALEFRFRLHSSSLNSNTSYEVLTGPTTITANPSTSTVIAGGLTINNVPLSSLDTDWWTVLVNKGGKSYIGTSRYGKALIYSSSAASATFNTTTATVPGSTRLNGYVNEFRLWSQNLDLEVYENHILAPTSFQGPQDDFIVGSTSSFDTLKIRHTFGADGKKWNISATSSMRSSHPNQNTGSTSATFSNFGSNTSDYWIPQIETNYIEVVDGGPNRQIGNKIRIENGVVSASNQVQTDASILGSIQDVAPVDSPRITVAFSPTDEIDEDINEQFGGINLDNYLGDPKDYYEDSYRGLDKLNNEYFKKYGKRNNTQGFIRLIQNYDSSLFQLIKQFVPERAVLHTGLVVQSHILHRNKVGQKQPSYENQYWSSSIAEHEQLLGGDTTQLTDTLEVYNFDIISGQQSYSEGACKYTPNVAVSESIDPGTTATTSAADTTTYGGDILILEDELGGANMNASKYEYYNWFKTGSGDSDWVYVLSVGEDQWNPFQPVVVDNAVSDEYTTQADRFNNQFTTEVLDLLNQNGANMSNILQAYGFSGSATDTTTVTTLNGQYVLQNSYTVTVSTP